MPEKEGIETIGELSICASDLKIIVISGGGRVQAQNYLAIAKCLGVAATFEKPIDLAALAAAVTCLIGSGDAAQVERRKGDRLNDEKQPVVSFLPACMPDTSCLTGQ